MEEVPFFRECVDPRDNCNKPDNVVFVYTRLFMVNQVEVFPFFRGGEKAWDDGDNCNET